MIGDKTQKERAPKGKRDEKRVPKKVTPSHLQNVALYYLERYAASAESLRRVLMRRVSKSAYHHDTDPAEGAEYVENIITRFKSSGLLDDRIYAEGQIKSLYRQGKSLRIIRGKLRDKGVDGDIVETLLETITGEFQNPDLIAAIKHARRRRLGPYRPSETREDRRQRDMASMARAGFDFGTASMVIDADSVDELDEMERS